MFGSNVANSSFLRIDDASLSKPPLIPFSSYAVEETNGLFVMSVVLPINSTSLTYAGLYSRTEKRTLRSVTLGFYVLAASPGGNEDLPTHLFGAGEQGTFLFFVSSLFEYFVFSCRAQLASCAQANSCSVHRAAELQIREL